MPVNDKSHYRTYTMRFMKNGISGQRNYRSLFSRLQKKEWLRCGSILQITKLCEEQKQKKAKSQKKQLLTIDYQPSIKETPNQSIEIKLSSSFQIVYNESPIKYQMKNKFRIKQSPKADSPKRAEKKRQFQKIMNDLNAKTMQILNRSNNYPKSSQYKVQKPNSNTELNFYHFRTIKGARQGISKQPQQKLQIDYCISPW